MKKIEAIIREERLGPVKDNLEELGYYGMTITEVSGRGKQKGISLKYRNRQEWVEFLPKLKVEVVVMDEDLSEALGAITKAARTGDIGDGKIFISTIDDAIRIRTGDNSGSAV